MLRVLGVGVRGPSAALALAGQHAACGAAPDCGTERWPAQHTGNGAAARGGEAHSRVRDWRDARVAPGVMIPEVVRRTALGIRVDRPQLLVADRGLAIGEADVLQTHGTLLDCENDCEQIPWGWKNLHPRAHRAAVELGHVVRVGDDVLAGPGVPAAGRVVHACHAFVVKLLCAARDILPAHPVTLRGADVTALHAPADQTMSCPPHSAATGAQPEQRRTGGRREPARC
eukprot:COSAG03_NODE_553_length_6971_cov_3.971624_9_plen_229_part_00